MRLMCGGLVCPGSGDAMRRVRFFRLESAASKAVGGVAGTAIHAAGLARQLSQKMTVSGPGVPSPGWCSQISRRAREERCARAAIYSCQTRALSSPASSSSSESTCAGLRPGQSVQKGLVTEINSFHYSTLTSPCRQALRSHINPSLDCNLNSLAKVFPN